MNILLSMDVEASGPAPLHGDMISFAAIRIEPGLKRFFDSGNMRPQCEKFSPGAYKAIGMTREQHLAAPYSIEERIEERILAFKDFATAQAEEQFALDLARAREQGRDPGKVNKPRCIMLSDNPGFDFQWMNFELLNVTGEQLLGHSARRIGDAWAGLRKRPNETQGWKKLRVSPHDHTPLNDAMGNAEAWQAMWEQHG
jgi:hypothetical protein